VEVVALVVSVASLILVLRILKTERDHNVEVVRELKSLDKKLDNQESTVGNLSSRLSLLLRMLRQHMKDGEILVQVGTANDRKLINALQAAGIYVQFDEFPQTELGRSKVIAEMLHGEEI
jgi:uncharacterized membrane-anchored protein YhcB (DUF1043 family)